MDTINENKFANTPTGNLIDELGNLNAAIKELEARQKDLSGEIKKRLSEGEEQSGQTFIANKKTSPRVDLDSAKAKAFIDASFDEEGRKAYYKTTKITRLNVTVRPVWAVAAE